MTSLIIGIDASRANAKERTGVEQYAYHVIQELKKIVPPEYRIRLYSPTPLQGDLAAFPPNWESRVLAWPPRRLWTQLRLSFEMLVRPPDALFVPAHALPVILPRRAVTTMHDVAFMAMPRAYTPQGNLYLRVDAWLATRRARILTVSEFSKSEIVKYFHAAPERITVTPLGFDAESFRPASPEAIAAMRQRYDLPGPYFLFVGRLERKKNLSGLLKAFEQFKETRGVDDHTQLILVGKPLVGYASEKRAVKACASLGAVRELGFVPEADKPALYSGAIATILPSHYEGFGLPVIESYACGTPAIVSNKASLPEVAGEGALQADPADPATIAAEMARMADDPALRSRLAAAGVAHAKRYSWETCARQTWEAIRATVSP